MFDTVGLRWSSGLERQFSRSWMWMRSRVRISVSAYSFDRAMEKSSGKTNGSISGKTKRAEESTQYLSRAQEAPRSRLVKLTWNVSSSKTDCSPAKRKKEGLRANDFISWRHLLSIVSYKICVKLRNIDLRWS